MQELQPRLFSRGGFGRDKDRKPGENAVMCFVLVSPKSVRKIREKIGVKALVNLRNLNITQYWWKHKFGKFIFGKQPAILTTF